MKSNMIGNNLAKSKLQIQKYLQLSLLLQMILDKVWIRGRGLQLAKSFKLTEKT